MENRLSEKMEDEHLWSQFQKFLAQTNRTQDSGLIKLEILFRSSDDDTTFADKLPHKQNNDSIECYRCKGHGHKANTCTNERYSRTIRCYACGQEGHMKAVCPSRICRRCYEAGHYANECTAPFCTRCQQPGHLREGGCRAAPPKCDDCKGAHHTIHCKLFTSRKAKEKKYVSIIRVNPNFDPKRKQVEHPRTPEEQARHDQWQALMMMMGRKR
ncbi:hypothetical protein J3E68DRAFT_406824 [Trichoderma sp. SZMC 28012]